MSAPVKSRRVLVVTNALPPTMPADSQRARILAASLAAQGWSVELLVPDAAFQIAVYQDVPAAALLPEGVPVHAARPGNDRLLRAAGMRSMAWRALWPMYRLGAEVLSRKPFDLVYITTAQFNFFCLGRLWKRKFGVPYILDFHDPWFRGQSQYSTTPINWKHYVGLHLAKHMERFALQSAAGLIAVSPDYLAQIHDRYPRFKCVQPGRNRAIPFGVLERDFEVAKASPPAASHAPAILEIIYVGAGRSIMAKSFQRICQGLARLRQSEPGLLKDLKIRLLGTYAYWTPGDPKELQTLAESEGVGDLVAEEPARIGYVKALRLALDAQGLLVLGVDDPAYMPSKLFLYALTGKPLLACLHDNSQVNDYFKRFPELGTLIHFFGPAEKVGAEDRLLRDFLLQVAGRQTFARDNIRQEYSGATMARQHVDLFEKCLNPS